MKMLIDSVKFSNTRLITSSTLVTKCFITFANTETRFENMTRSAVFFEVFANLRNFGKYFHNCTQTKG